MTVMLQAVAASVVSPRRVAALDPGPLGLRFRVRGLLGNRGLATWIEQATSPVGPVHVSASSGIVRVNAALTVRSVDWATELERCVAAFDAVDLPRRDRPARRRRAAAPRTLRETRALGGTSAAAPTAGGTSKPFHAWPTKALLRHLVATPSGLSGAEAASRLARDGANELRDITARSDAEILLSQFKSVPVALLAGSGATALGSGALGDAAAIGAVLAVNGGIGYATERQAEQTVSALRKLAPQSTVALRNGRELQIPAREVAIGDVLVLKPGQPVAADARVIESHRLSANEAPLTGESLPVRKEPVEQLPPDTPVGERRNLLHMGTVISGGTGRAVVVATGERTVLGRIRALAQAAEAPRTRLQSELDGLGKRLAVGASALCLGVLGIGLLRGRPALPMLRTAVALGVAAIPEGLPTVATSLLAAGIRTLRKRDVYARRMDAIENLGAVDVVGFDKTGTLTQNRMSVATVSIGRRRTAAGARGKLHALPADFSLVAALCNDLERANGGAWQGSSTEIALIEFASACGASVDKLRRLHPRREVKQRSEHHPYMVTLHAAPRGAHLVAVKGRPQEVLERCTRWFDGKAVVPLTAAERRRVLRENGELAALGERVLGFALKRQKTPALGETGGLTWLGLVGLSDPLRPGIAESIARFKAAGIRPVMLTGDQMATAQAVADAIGLDGPAAVTDAGALPEDAKQLKDAVERASGFARSSPAMKLQIIRALQSRGHVVAMTGDGINDGPALKTADIGVAMGASGTDFAQAMSDLVLKGDHPDGLLEAIAEGRTAYLNVKKAVKYLVATNVSELATMALSVAAGLPDPLDPLALLWTNLITDISPAIALGLEPPEPDILERPPFPREAAFLSRKDWRGVAVDGGMITAATMAGFLYGLARYGPSPRARTLAFMTMTSAQLVYALSARSEAPLAIFGRGRLRANPWLSRTVVLSLAAQAATVLFPPLRALLRTTPIDLADAAVIAACAVAPTLGREGLKRLRRAAGAGEGTGR
jgi:Ca2+-transporting ATPase